MLGSATMRDSGLAVGDSVIVDGVLQEDGEPGPPATLSVVGRAVLPAIAQYSGSDKLSFGTRRHLHRRGSPGSLTRQQHGRLRRQAGTGCQPRLAPGRVEVISRDARRPRLVRQRRPTNRPSDIVSLDRLRSTPVVLSSLLVLLVAGTVANALLAAIRRRRRDLAVLEVFGATRRQVIATVAWQASTIAVVGHRDRSARGHRGRSLDLDRAGVFDGHDRPTGRAGGLAGRARRRRSVARPTWSASCPGLRAARTRPAVASEVGVGHGCVLVPAHPLVAVSDGGRCSWSAC